MDDGIYQWMTVYINGGRYISMEDGIYQWRTVYINRGGIYQWRTVYTIG